MDGHRQWQLFDCCNQHIFGVVEEARVHHLPEECLYVTTCPPLLKRPKTSKILVCVAHIIRKPSMSAHCYRFSLASPNVFCEAYCLFLMENASALCEAFLWIAQYDYLRNIPSFDILHLHTPSKFCLLAS